ncbi:MAG: hypothetical protein ACREDC_06920, partial [Bradyrhizobium sp.]
MMQLLVTSFTNEESIKILSVPRLRIYPIIQIHGIRRLGSPELQYRNTALEYSAYAKTTTRVLAAKGPKRRRSRAKRTA